MLGRIDHYLHMAPRVLCDVVALPPFTLYFNRESDSPFLSYARPSEELEAGDETIVEVIRAFADRGRTPRWEWIDDLYPELAPALGRAGIAAEVTPLMRVTREGLRRDEPAGFEIREVPEEELAPMIRAQRRSFGMGDEAPSDSEFATVRSWLDRGGRFFAAFSGGEVAGAGGYLPIEGVAEVAGVGTVPEFRRRGVGGAVTAALVDDAFARGCECVFLTAGDDAAVSLYRRVGFQVIGRGMAAMG